MDCLYCGDCCLRMSPKSQPLPCHDIIQKGTFYFCGCYLERPDECKNHEFPMRFCPIGMEKLNIHDLNGLRQRIDEGFDAACKLYPELEE